MALTALLALAATAQAESGCRGEAFEDNAYTVCSFDVGDTDLRVFWQDSGGAPPRMFSALARDLAARDDALVFAMNGGMYHEDLSPVGLLVIDGTEVNPVNKTDAPADIKPVPNFYKKPNGIFFIGGG